MFEIRVPYHMRKCQFWLKGKTRIIRIPFYVIQSIEQKCLIFVIKEENNIFGKHD